jgi:hypothetical protein
MLEVAAVVEIATMKEVVEIIIEMTTEVVEVTIEAVEATIEAANVAEAKVEVIVMITRRKRTIKITTTHPAIL